MTEPIIIHNIHPAGTAVSYSFAVTRWGEMLFASTEQGLCIVSFAPDRATAVSRLLTRVPGAVAVERATPFHERAAALIDAGQPLDASLPLHLAGTQFQLAVWQALARVPRGATISYSELARQCGRPSAVRAVGSAVSANPIAILLPCHRIVPKSAVGKPLAVADIGQYFWGEGLKLRLLCHELL